MEKAIRGALDNGGGKERSPGGDGGDSVGWSPPFVLRDRSGNEWRDGTGKNAGRPLYSSNAGEQVSSLPAKTHFSRWAEAPPARPSTKAVQQRKPMRAEKEFQIWKDKYLSSVGVATHPGGLQFVAQYATASGADLGLDAARNKQAVKKAMDRPIHGDEREDWPKTHEAEWRPLGCSQRSKDLEHGSGWMTVGDFNEYNYDRDLAVLKSMPTEDFRTLRQKEREWQAALVEVEAGALATQLAKEGKSQL
eukprot:gene24229-9828_t